MPILAQDPLIEEESKLLSNSIYGVVGISGAWVTASGYYERIINPKYNESNTHLFIRVGYVAAGGFAVGEHIAIEGGLLIGKGNSYFELGAGWHKAISKWYDFVPLGGSIGYRYMKPQGHLIFRTGLSYIEGLYAGIGLRL